MRATAAVALALAALALTGCSAAEEPGPARSGDLAELLAPGEGQPQTTTVRGQLRLYGSSNFRVKDNGYLWCLGRGADSDLYYGAEVLVKDAGGRTVALGELDEGYLSEDRNICIFEFEVPGVPDTQDVFTLDMEGRGRDEFTLAQVRGDETALWYVLGDKF